MYIEEYIIVIGCCIALGVLIYDSTKELVEWAIETYYEVRLYINYRKIYWFWRK